MVCHFGGIPLTSSDTTPIQGGILSKPSEFSKERSRASGQIDLRHLSPSSLQEDRWREREREREEKLNATT